MRPLAPFISTMTPTLLKPKTRRSSTATKIAAQQLKVRRHDKETQSKGTKPTTPATQTKQTAPSKSIRKTRFKPRRKSDIDNELKQAKQQCRELKGVSFHFSSTELPTSPVTSTLITGRRFSFPAADFPGHHAPHLSALLLSVIFQRDFVKKS